MKMMSDPELSPLDDLGSDDSAEAPDLPDLGGELPDLGGESDLPDLGGEGDPLDEAIAELQDVLDRDEAMGSIDGDPASANAAMSPGQAPGDPGLQGLVMSLPVQVDVVIGSADMPVSDLIGMETGAVVMLNRKIGEPVDICVNGTKIASGEIETLEDDPTRLGVRITSLVKS
jgi:flagellar motor switch protein FliN/FliY